MPNTRTCLPEYKKFTDLLFEIQLRTILEHSWAEIEHDRRYKYSGIFPKDLDRRFSLLSAVLELADHEFDNISKSIERYADEVLEKTRSGNLDIPIDSTSLRQYLDEMTKEFAFTLSKKNDEIYNRISKNLVLELHDIGIDTLEKLNNLLKKNVDNIRNARKETTYAGIIRIILIISFGKDYFEKAWNQHWIRMHVSSASFYKEVGVDIDTLAQKFGIEIFGKLNK